MRTQSVSRKRSKSLRLEFHPDFWEFYRINRESVDHIIGIAITKASAKYPSYIPSKLEPGDIKNDVMRLLFLNKFMDSWDSSKSQLNTYFTNKARWYVKRVIQKVVDSHSHLTSRIGHQVIMNGLNKVCDEDNAIELASKYYTDDEFIANNYEEVLSEHLNERTREVAKLTTQGLSQKEIADIYEVSTTNIGGYCQVIRDTAKKLFCEPKTTTVPKFSKNNHGRNKKRPLTVMEKNRIQEQFLAVNGIVQNDFCLRLKNEVGSNISIFQVTGYVKELHNRVKSGDLQVADLASYMTLREQRRQLWASYRSERYRKMREKLYGQAV